MTPIPTLYTGRLTLRAFVPEDAQVLHRIHQHEDVLRYFPNPVPPPLDRVERFVASQLAHWERYGYGNWGVVPDGAGEIAGWAGLQYLPELDAVEVGFLLDRSMWGRGYATEAARASLRFAFEQLEPGHDHLDHIIALVHPDNLASQRVIEKCGMQRVETLALWGLSLIRYSVARESWSDSLAHDTGATPERVSDAARENDIEREG